MTSNHISYTDARGSNFNDVHRDQIWHHNNITINWPVIHVNLSLFGLGWTHQSVPLSSGNDLSLPTSGFRILSGGQPLVAPHHSFDSISAIGTAVNLIIKITSLLIDQTDSSNNRRDLVLELKLLHQILTLTGLAVQEYEIRPLGQGLAHTITPEIERCCTALQELLDKASSTWLGLNSTSMSDLWRPVWWGRWDGNKFALLKKELSDIRKSIEVFMVALHSYA
jgi:hypothetical protein